MHSPARSESTRGSGRLSVSTNWRTGGVLTFEGDASTTCFQNRKLWDPPRMSSTFAVALLRVESLGMNCEKRKFVHDKNKLQILGTLKVVESRQPCQWLKSSRDCYRSCRMASSTTRSSATFCGPWGATVPLSRTATWRVSSVWVFCSTGSTWPDFTASFRWEGHYTLSSLSMCVGVCLWAGCFRANVCARMDGGAVSCVNVNIFSEFVRVLFICLENIMKRGDLAPGRRALLEKLVEYRERGWTYLADWDETPSSQTSLTGGGDDGLSHSSSVKHRLAPSLDNWDDELAAEWRQRYGEPVNLPPLRHQSVAQQWSGTQGRCDDGISSQSARPTLSGGTVAVSSSSLVSVISSILFKSIL